MQHQNKGKIFNGRDTQNNNYSGMISVFVLGLIITLSTAFVSKILIYVFGIVSVIFAFNLVFAVAGSMVRGFLPEQNWKAGILLSFPYLLLTVYVLLNFFSSDTQGKDGHWEYEFFPLAFFLYISPVITVCLSANAAFAFSNYKILVPMGMLALVFVGAIYINDDSAKTKTNIASFNLIENENVQLRTDIQCERTITKDYMRFRNYDEGGCREAKIFVLKRNPSCSLPTTAYWTINGVEQFRSMFPINGADDSSTIDYSKSVNFDDVPVWKMEIPSEQIAQSQRVHFKWGKIDFEFGESEFSKFRNLMEDYKQLNK